MPQLATSNTRTVLHPSRAGQWPDRDPGSGDRDPGSGDEVERDAEDDVDRISVELLGGLRVRAGGSTMGPGDLGGAKPRRILLALLLHRGAPVSKDRLVSLLWEGAHPLGARATLESYVCLLRKKLQPEEPGAASPITTVAGAYAIDMARVDLDVAVYERLLAVALRPGTCPTEALPMLAEAMVLAESPLLPEEVNCQWLDEVRTTHNHDVRRALVAAADKVAALVPATAERWARTALDADPLDESAWRALLQGMEACGRHVDGLRTFDQCRRLFAAELGCAPGPGLQALHVRLLRGANEDNDELGRLFEAVLRLHTASRVDASPAVTHGRRDGGEHADSVEQAWQALDMLLRSVPGNHRPHLALGA